MSRPTTNAVSHAYALTPLQVGMLFHGSYDQDNLDYQEQVVFRILGDLDKKRLQAAFGAAIHRHESLRSAFVSQAQRDPIGVVFKPEAVSLPTQRLDWRGYDEQGKVRALKDLLAQDHAKGYNLKRPPLARLYLAQLGSDEHYCVFCHHHLILDGWSLAILLREVLEDYERDAPPHRLCLQAPWKDYRAHLAKSSRAQEAQAWRAILGQKTLGTQLPGQRSCPGEASQEIRLELTPAQRDAWEQGCKDLRITPSSLLQAAYALALGRATGQSRVGLGITLSGRPTQVAGADALVGLLINTLPLAVDLDPAQESHAYLRAVSQRNLWLQEHQCAGLSDLQKWVGQAPLFNTVVVFDNYPIQSLLDASERAAQSGRLRTVSLTPKEHEALGPQAAQRNHYPLTLVAMPGQAQWWLGAAFDGARIDPAAVRALLDSVAKMAVDLVQRVCPLGEIPWQVQTSAARARVQGSVRDWSCAPQAVQDKTAVVERSGTGRRRLSWGELQTRVARVRTRLLREGLQREDRVLLCVERGMEWVVSFLGIQSAGACAVLVDPETPLERIQVIAQDSQARGLIGEAPLDAVGLKRWDARALSQEGVESLLPMPTGLHPDNLAYILYTSGSTGTPKGVAITHGNWSAYAQGFGRAAGLDEGLCYAWLSGSAVDLGHTSILGALHSHGSLVVVRPELAGDPDALSQALCEESVDVLKLAPTHMSALLDAASDPAGIVPRVAWVSGGEALSPELASRVKAVVPGCRILNHYGPTETTVGVALQDPWLADEPSCMGRAMPHARLVARDPWGQALPAGLSGELWISGDTVARGYWRDPRKTALCFVPDPEASEPGQRAYKSGDRVIQGEQGYSFEGRMDRQLKIRGFRVEPAEVEAWLKTHAQVQHAVVFAEPICQGEESSGAAKNLWVALVPGRQSPALEEIQESAKRGLPAALVPSQWMLRESLPLLASGKVDRAKLAMQAASENGWRGLPTGGATLASALSMGSPENQADQGGGTVKRDKQSSEVSKDHPLVASIQKIWSAVLKREIQDPHANFFSLGGDSILSLQVVARAKKAGLAMLPKDLFEHPTVAGLALALENKNVKNPQSAATSTRASSGPASRVRLPAEHWFAEQQLEDPGHFYQSLMLALQEGPDRGAFLSALETLSRRHDLGLHQEGLETAWVEIEDWSRAQSLVGSKAQALQAQLGRGDAPGLRLVCFVPRDPLGRESKSPAAWLACLAHHRSVDAVSWRILLQELAELMRGAALPELALSAEAFGRALYEKAQAGGFDAQLDFWHAQTRVCDAATHGATDRDYQERLLVLDSQVSQQLRQGLSEAHRAGIQEALLCAWVRAMARLGQDETVVELEGHGRSWSQDLDLSGAVAWCTARYPLRFEAQPGLRETLRSVQEKVAAVLDGGAGYGVLRYWSAHGKELQEREVLDVTLNYLGQLDRAWAGDFVHPASQDPTLRPDLGAQRCAQWRPKAALRITASLRAQELALRLDADPQRWPQAKLDALVRALQEELMRIGEALACQAPVRWHRRDLASSLRAGLGVGPESLDPVLEKVAQLGPVQALLPAAPAQVALWLQDQKQQGTRDRAYWNQFIVAWRDLPQSSLIAAFEGLAEHFEVLRTAFCSYGEGGLLQVLLKEPRLPVYEVALSPGDEASESKEFSALAHARDLMTRPVADSGALPWELVLAQGGKGRVWMAFTRHHILLDGWSTGKLLAAFAGQLEGKPLPPAATPYSDYLKWVYRQDQSEAREFWGQRLDGVAPMPAKLGHRVSQAQKEEPQRRLCQARMPEHLVQALRARGARLGLTMNLWCQAAWAQVLSMYSGRREVVFGIVDAGRDPQLEGSESIVGLMMQTLPLAVTIEATDAREAWLTALRDLNLQMRRFGSRALEWKQRGLWQSLLVFENYPLEQELGDKLGQVLRVQRIEETHYPLTLSVDALGSSESGMGLALRYDSRLYDAPLAQSLLDAFIATLEDLAHQEWSVPLARAGRPKPSIAVLASGSQSPRIDDQIDGQIDGQGLMKRIEAVAQAQGQAIALRQGDGQTLSYAAMMNQVHSAARALRQRGIGLEEPVGVCLPRSNELVVATLAVLAAGAYYVPIDPEIPLLRQQELCDCAGLRALVHSEPAGAPPCSRIWTLQDLLAEDSVTEALPEIVDSQLAYQIFTSGSTGTPKGVGVEHRQVTRLVQGLSQQLGLGPQDTWTLFHRHAFDVSVWEVFGALCSGAKLVIIDEAMQRDPARYAACLRDEAVTVASETPSAYYLLQDAILADPQLTPMHLRHVMFAGEALDVQQLRPWPQSHPSLCFWDLYGNTETTVHATLGRVQGLPHSVGQALEDLRIELLDEQWQRLPAGAVGEICIAGPGVTRGYLDNPRETAQRFVPDEGGEPGARAYRSGDLASRSAQGDLHYVGRVDRQVQLRGFRIELAEVEGRLRQACEGRRVRVEMQGQGPLARLLAFVEDPDQSMDLSALEQWSRRSLADYQRPAQIVALPRFALTANGKLDRAWLLSKAGQARSSLQAGESSSLPTSAGSERMLAITGLWQSVLERQNLAQVDPHASFFSLGGHSLLAVTMLNRFAERFGQRIELAEFLNAPTRVFLEQALGEQGKEGKPQPSADDLFAMLDDIEKEQS